MATSFVKTAQVVNQDSVMVFHLTEDLYCFQGALELKGSNNGILGTITPKPESKAFFPGSNEATYGTNFWLDTDGSVHYNNGLKQKWAAFNVIYKAKEES